MKTVVGKGKPNAGLFINDVPLNPKGATIGETFRSAGYLAAILGCVVLAIAPAVLAADELERGFQNPPDSAKPQTWWHWMDNNVTREGITADLEAMKRAGLGGAHIFNVGQNIPNGSMKCFSPEWFALVNHAVKEADRLGLELGMHNCPGWSSSGGPWITPELATQQLTTSEQTVQGPTHFSPVLAQPETFSNYYRDVAVLAFPSPDGEPAQLWNRTPKITSNCPGFDPARLLKDKPGSAVALALPPMPAQPYIQIEFPEPCPIRSFQFEGNFKKPFALQASDDGVAFKTIRTFSGYYDVMALREGTFVAGNKPITARFYRVQFQREKLSVSALSLSNRLGIEKFQSKAAVWRILGSFTKSDGQIPADDVAGFVGQTIPGFVVPREHVIDLTSRLKPDGHLDWDAPPGRWTLLRIGHTAGRAVNKPAPEGGSGLECDKFSKAAVEAHWAGMMGKIAAQSGALTGKTLVGATIDSWEVGFPNWTANFPEEFRRRRGYDLHPYLPILSNRVVESPEVTERFLWDYRHTVADLFAENYYGQMTALAHRQGMQLSAECYGNGPFDPLDCDSVVDIPMGEFWTDGAPELTCKFAASAAHTQGRKFVATESFTGGSKWRENPFSLKAVGDRMYCIGVNRFVFHTFAMQPWLDQSPGMTVGQFGSHIQRNNTWWNQAKPWFDYLARCQFLLQEGQFVADVCALGNEDYLTGLVDLPQPELPPGYDHDLCGCNLFLTAMEVENGLLALPSGMRYRFLILPDARTLSLPVVKKVRDLIAAGGTVIGPKPQFSPTLENYPACQAEIRQIADEVWGPCDGKTVTEHPYGKGRVIWGETWLEILGREKLPPDFDAKKTSQRTHLNSIHRKSEKADWYFVASEEKEALETVCAFRVTGKRPELWYPDTGKIEKAGEYWMENGQTFVPMHFDPCGSVFVMFREKAEGNGRKVELKPLAEPKPLMELSGPWEVSFDSKWFYPDNGTGAKVRFEQLSDWSKRHEDAVKYFSGTAVYEKEFEVPASVSNGALYLDLGQVEVIAEVELNGKNLGVLWKPPFKVDITEAVKAGEKNMLRVKVTNLWPNRLIGDEHLPADCEYKPDGSLKAWPQWLTDHQPRTSGRRTFTTWQYYEADDSLLPSGLLGPVRLVPATANAITGK